MMKNVLEILLLKKIDWASMGFEIPPLQACNGKEALEIAKDYKPDLVFADIKMPVMNGIELTKQLKKNDA